MRQNHAGTLEETKRHGSVLFPFIIYPCTIPGDFPSVALHWHKSMELIYVKKGRGSIQMGLEQLEATAGDIFVLPPGTLHSLRGLPGQKMEYENMMFETELLGVGAADVCARKYLIPLSGGQLLYAMHLQPDAEGYSAVAACLEQAEQLSENRNSGYELGIKAAMLQLIYTLLQLQPEQAVPESPQTARLKQVLQLVEAAYGQPLRVEQAAAVCGLSASHFMRWFRQMTGSSFTAFLKEYRLAAAAEQLRLTGNRVEDIARTVGYESLSNFNRQFRERYGVTPREYRKHEAEPDF